MHGHSSDLSTDTRFVRQIDENGFVTDAPPYWEGSASQGMYGGHYGASYDHDSAEFDRDASDAVTDHAYGDETDGYVSDEGYDEGYEEVDDSDYPRRPIFTEHPGYQEYQDGGAMHADYSEASRMWRDQYNDDEDEDQYE
jgi:hypothetical protein